MIGEAVDTAFTLGWALLAWIVLTAGVAVLALYAVVAIVVAPVQAAREALSGALAASRAHQALPEPQTAHRPPRANTGPHAPSWAHTDKEAA